MRLSFTFRWLLLATGFIGTGLSAAVPVRDAVRDVQDFQSPANVHLSGWVGQRVQLSEINRLVKMDPDRLLEGYRKRPGRQAWDGEHVGKWLHAATLAWVNTGDPALRAKLDRTVRDLMACQLEDGYLGTYLEKDRWTEWDVWSHKYNLIGLLTYVQYTGDETPLTTCRRMGDLLCTTFGDTAGKRDIITSGHHMGMASTSVLEPMVLLYRITGEKRYLDFCDYILRAWEQPNGPKIISTLLRDKRVDRVGNAKAYEMLSCLNGALEYYRTTGDRRCLQAAINAWEDIVAKRLYLTGAASYKEHFHDDYDLPNQNDVGETCVTVTWLQLNAQLLRLTGESRYADQLEKVILNQLFGAQRPDCAAWGYYVQMAGTKPYSDNMDGHCCLSSGPRGIALIPSFAITRDREGMVVNLYDAGTAQLPTPAGNEVNVAIRTGFPSEEHIDLSISLTVDEEFSVRLRVPEWVHHARLEMEGSSVEFKSAAQGYAVIKRRWKKGENRLNLFLPLESRVVRGDHGNRGQVAFCSGPLVLAFDESQMPDGLRDLNKIFLQAPAIFSAEITVRPVSESLRTWPGEKDYRLRVSLKDKASPVEIPLVTFAKAGSSGARYQVWMPWAE